MCPVLVSYSTNDMGLKTFKVLSVIPRVFKTFIYTFKNKLNEFYHIMDNLNVMFIFFFFFARSNVHFSSNDNHSLSMTPIIEQLNQLERAAGGNLGPQRHVSPYCHPSSFFLDMLCYFPCVQTRARIVMIHTKKK